MMSGSLTLDKASCEVTEGIADGSITGKEGKFFLLQDHPYSAAAGCCCVLAVYRPRFKCFLQSGGYEEHFLRP